jgi:hypothetical protein
MLGKGQRLAHQKDYQTPHKESSRDQRPPLLKPRLPLEFARPKSREGQNSEVKTQARVVEERFFFLTPPNDEGFSRRMIAKLRRESLDPESVDW